MAERRMTDENSADGAGLPRAGLGTGRAVDRPAQAASAAPEPDDSRPRTGRLDRDDPAGDGDGTSEDDRERRVRRARFLAELAEARELRKRVAPRRARAAELHARVLRTFRY